MAYTTVDYFPELERPNYKLLMERIVENSKADTFEEAKKEWKCHKLNFNLEDCQCICSKVIFHTHFIDNVNTKKSLILGSCCIKKFIPEVVKCTVCGDQLNDICKRLKTNNHVCPECTRQRIKKLSKYKYFVPGKYANYTFSSLINNDKFLDMIANKAPIYMRSDVEFLEFMKLKKYEIVG